MMTKKNKGINENKQKKKVGKKSFLLIFICIFASAALVLGLVLGIISAQKQKNVAVSFKGVGMSYEVASYFASRYKSAYKSMLAAAEVPGVEDSPGFWNRDSGNGQSYGELLEEGVRKYISRILVTNYLFDKYSSLTKSDKEIISRAIEGTLLNSGGNKDVFNKEVGIYGFSYSSYKDAATMLYKDELAQSVVCGPNGENLKDEASLIDEYIEEYSHVKLLFIRTETGYVLDADGNRVVEDDGRYAIRELSESEKAARHELISEIRSYIDAIGSDEASMGAEMFDYYLENHDEGAPETHDYGFYFHKDSDFTKQFDIDFGNSITSTAYDMEIGEFGEAAVDFGTCFIYKLAPSASDLEISSLENFFGDFYTNLSDSFFAEHISEFYSEVKFKDKYDSIDLILIPYNYSYFPIWDEN